MSAEKSLFPVTLLGKPFTVKCEMSQQENLMKNIELITEMGRRIQQNSLAMGFEQSLIAIALELAEQLQQEKTARITMVEQLQARLFDLEKTISSETKSNASSALKKPKNKVVTLEEI